MALYPNGRLIFYSPGRHFGPGAGLEVLGRLRGDRMNRFLAENYDDASSTPNGYGIAAAVPAIKPGGLASTVTGSGGASGSAILAVLMSALLNGQGNLTAAGGLIVNLAASIQGSGGISQADIKAFLQLAATIGGSGNIAATATGLGAIVAALAGSGGISATPSGVGQLAAVLRGYGDLTPEGLRDAVWDAIATNFNKPGTMGSKLNAASSGGVDLNALAAAVWTYTSRALTEGGISPADQQRILDIWQRLGLNPAAPMVTTTTSIDAGTVRQSISESAGTITVTRLP